MPREQSSSHDQSSGKAGAASIAISESEVVTSYMSSQKTAKSWTPGFIVLFGLLLACGLGLASVLTQGKANGFYPAEPILLGYCCPLLVLWLALLLRTRIALVRLGAVFGLVVAGLLAWSYLLNFRDATGAAVAMVYLTGATSAALLGSAICLSLADRPLQRWDRWFFCLLPLAILAGLALAYRTGAHTPQPLVSALNTLLLLAATATWWLRPSCWRTQPVAAIFFGVVPLLLRFTLEAHRPGVNFFYAQVMLLFLLLGLLRVYQHERRSVSVTR